MATISCFNQPAKIGEIVEAIRLSYAETKERVDLVLNRMNFVVSITAISFSAVLGKAK